MPKNKKEEIPIVVPVKESVFFSVCCRSICWMNLIYDIFEEGRRKR